jgi:hypothetical protein
MERLQEDRIFGQEVSAKAGLFIHHQFEEVAGMGDHEVGVINHACAPLIVLQSKAKDKGKDGQGSNGQRKEPDQKSIVLPRIHGVSPLFAKPFDSQQTQTH